MGSYHQTSDPYSIGLCFWLYDQGFEFEPEQTSELSKRLHNVNPLKPQPYKNPQVRGAEVISGTAKHLTITQPRVLHSAYNCFSLLCLMAAQRVWPNAPSMLLYGGEPAAYFLTQMLPAAQ